MNWRSIRLELASTAKFPSGSVSRTYLLSLPLDDFDAVDKAACLRHPSRATVRRHWSSEPDQHGVVVPNGQDWVMRCDNEPERLLRLDGLPVRLGQRVSIVEADGKVLPFTIASVR